LEARAPGEEQPGAKELFFDPEAGSISSSSGRRPQRPLHARELDSSGRRVPRSTTADKQVALGLSYWIELADEHGVSIGMVTDQHTFRSGDRIRIHFRSNTDGRVMLIQMGSSGTSSVLFPALQAGLSENQLPAREDRVFPAPERWFKFDRNPGTETLLALFARSQTELERSFPTRATMNAEETAALAELAHDAPGRKDLMIETDTHSTADPGTYAVSVAGKPIILQIVLKHR
jgi:hypothetical protein